MHNDIEDFKKLDVWKVSMNLVAKVYKLTDTFPSDEGLRSDLNSAAISIPCNIAKGTAMEDSQEDLVRAAMRSLNEILILLDVAVRLDQTTEDKVHWLREDYLALVGRLYVYLKSVTSGEVLSEYLSPIDLDEPPLGIDP